MKRSHLTLSIGAVVALAALAACSSDNTTNSSGATITEMNTASEQDAGQDAAMTVAQLGDNEISYGAGDIVSGRNPGANFDVAGISVNCTGPDGSGWFTCTAVTERGLTIVRQLRFWQGTSYGLWWSPTLTDSVNHIWTADGTVQGFADPGRTIVIADSQAGTMVVTRPPAGVNAVVSGPLHTWTGAGDQHHTATWTGQNGVERILTHTGNDSVNAVQFMMPRSSNPYPLSGNIIINVTNHLTAGNFDRTATRRYVITFNGTNTATLQDGGVTCDLLLDPPHTISNCH